MHFALLTQNAPPQICGIGDHSLRFADALRAAGHHATVLARRGLSEDGVEIVPGEIGRDWLAAVVDRLDRFGSDHLILQYTPLMYSSGRWRIERELLRCWRSLCARRSTSLIVHETFFRVWWYPPSLLRGMIQRALLRRFAAGSRNVFSASEPLHEEMSGWALARTPVFLPIGSNIPVAEGDTPALRQSYGIAEREVVLALFGGGTSLKWSAGHVDMVEAKLNEAGIPHCWLLLGGIPRDWFSLTARVLSPGRLSSADLSAHLQLTDIFLMPHVSGLSAKRGTLMAALEHALPVVGTRGPMTDAFWSTVAGVMLVDVANAAKFAAAVVALCPDRQRRQTLGRKNAEYYREKFAWPKIARKFLDTIEIN